MNLGVSDTAFIQQNSLASKRHFEMLDGIRGVAAMAVVLFHTYQGGGIMPNGPLAVDLFFLLSGFVIAYSYGDKIGVTMSSLEFLRRRVIRLYPMIFIGAFGGFVIALLHNKTNPAGAYPLHSILSSGTLSLVVLPYLVPGIMGIAIFSFNPPIWSLFFEFIGNIVYALLAKLMTPAVLMVIVAIALVAIGVGGGLGGGAKDNFWLGFPRIFAGFFGGVLLYKIWQTGRLAQVKSHFAVIVVALLAIFAFPIVVKGWLFIPVFALFLLIIIAAANAVSSRADKLYALLGNVSYPLYLTHWLTLYFLTFIGAKLGMTGGKYVVVAVAEAIIAPIVGYGFYRFYEYRALNFLKPSKQPA